MVELEKNLEDPNDETRVRFLEGHDLPPTQLKDKVQEVGSRAVLDLHIQNDVVLDEVAMLVDWNCSLR